MQPRLLRSPARLAGSSLLRMQSDERLVALARDGHEQAFAAIFERYRSDLERYATRLVGASRGEDAVQQAFVNAHRSLTGNPDRTIELRPWLYRIVHNAALNTLRGSRDEQPLGDEAERLSLSEDAVERRELLREALEAVAALPDKQRDAILLRELEGRSHEEIAVALGLSTGAARQQIFRARAALRAAATAVTPTPLLLRLMEIATSSGGSGGADLATAAGGGLAAVVAKASAGVLVTGAVVGGAVGSGVVDTPGGHPSRARTDEAAKIVPAAQRDDRRAVLKTTSGTSAVVAGHHRSSKHAGRDDGGSSASQRRRNRGSGSTPSAGSGPSRNGAHHAPAVAQHHTASTDDGPGSGSTTTSEDGHRRGRGGSGKSTSGKHSGGGEAADATETATEAPEVETEAPGDVSGKNGINGGGGGGDQTTTTTTAPSAPTTDPAVTGSGGGGKTSGGSTSQALTTSSGGKN